MLSGPMPARVFVVVSIVELAPCAFVHLCSYLFLAIWFVFQVMAKHLNRGSAPRSWLAGSRDQPQAPKKLLKAVAATVSLADPCRRLGFDLGGVSGGATRSLLWKPAAPPVRCAARTPVCEKYPYCRCPDCHSLHCNCPELCRRGGIRLFVPGAQTQHGPYMRLKGDPVLIAAKNGSVAVRASDLIPEASGCRSRVYAVPNYMPFGSMAEFKIGAVVHWFDIGSGDTEWCAVVTALRPSNKPIKFTVEIRTANGSQSWVRSEHLSPSVDGPSPAKRIRRGDSHN